MSTLWHEVVDLLIYHDLPLQKFHNMVDLSNSFPQPLLQQDHLRLAIAAIAAVAAVAAVAGGGATVISWSCGKSMTCSAPLCKDHE